MVLKIFPLLIGGTLISGGVATAVVVSQRNTENSKLERNSTSSTDTKEQKTQDDQHQVTIPSVQGKQDPLQGEIGSQISNPEGGIKGSGTENTDGSLASEFAYSHSENPESSSVEERRHTEPPANKERIFRFIFVF